MNNAVRKILLAFGLALPFFMCACGDDSGSGAHSSQSSSSSAEDNLGGEDYVDSTLAGEKFNSGMGEATVVKGEVLDVTDGISYKTIQFGPYTWMAENASLDDVHSKCYNDESAKCKSNGRLYQIMYADDACPRDFRIPTEADFRYMAAFAKNISAPSFGFNPQMSGFCEEVNGQLSCSGLKETGYLLTSSFNVFKMDFSGKAELVEANMSAYYALRCVKFSHFVENKKQLPTCDASTYKDMDDIYVASEGVNYYCDEDGWGKTNNSYCPSTERGQKNYYKDSLFVCDGSWRLATMDDVDVECTEENQWMVQKVNGLSYICDDSEWRKPSVAESRLGICLADSIGKIGVAADSSNTTEYYCDTTGWRPAVLTDSIGVCTEKRQWKVKKSYGTGYVCENEDWRKLTEIEAVIGLCIPDSIKKMAFVKEDGRTKDYYCDTTGWRRAVLKDSIGACTKAKRWKEASNYGKNYLCYDGSWRVADDLEESIGFCVPDIEGKVDSTEIDGYTEYYACNAPDGWRDALLSDMVPSCEKGVYDSVYEFRDVMYVCSRSYEAWVQMSDLEIALGICTFKKVGKIDTLKSTGVTYTCDSTGWRKAVINDYYGKCESSKLYTKKSFDGDIYGCENPPNWTKLTYPTTEFGFCKPAMKGTIQTDKKGVDYICDSLWRMATKSEVLGDCNEDNVTSVKKFSSVSYTCDGEKWRTLTAMEVALGLCNERSLGDEGIFNSTTYICADTGWKVYTVADKYGSCEYSDAGTVVDFASKKFACKPYKWVEMDSLELEIGPCYSSNVTRIVSSAGGDYYKCSGNTWTFASAHEVLEKCTAEMEGQIEEYRGKKYFCSASLTWQEYTDLEADLGFCGASNLDSMAVHDGKNYGCTIRYNGDSRDFYVWRVETELDVALGFCHGSSFSWAEYKNKDYVCSADGGRWINSTFWGMYTSCNKNSPEKYGVVVGYEGQHYYCDIGVSDTFEDEHGWYALQPVDSVKTLCNKSTFGDTLVFEGDPYYCGKNKNGFYRWLVAENAADYLGKCESSNAGAKATFTGVSLVCSGGAWHRDPGDYGTLTDTRDEIEYKTIVIGNQTWMAENLRYATVKSNSWCPEGNVSACASKGRLYDWASAMDLSSDVLTTVVDPAKPGAVQGVCPDGWRLPTEDDWRALIENRTVAGLMKKTVSSYDSAHHDQFGFSALNVGYQNGESYVSSGVAFWSVSEKDEDEVYIARLESNLEEYADKSLGLPVRCIKK